MGLRQPRRSRMRPFRSSTAALITLVGSFLAPSLAGADELPVIDCHVHLWDTQRPEMTWPRKEHTELFKPFLPDTHEKICASNGVTGVVVVLSGQALVDNQWNLDVTAHNPQLYLGFVGNLSLAIATDEFAPLFEKLCKDPRYVGYRLSGRYQKGITDSLIRDLKLTAKNGRTVDFLVGGYSLQEIDEIARRIPELKIIVDHFGGVQLGDGGRFDPAWAEDFRKVAKRPNVFCKYSALYGRFKEQPAPTELAPYQAVIDLAFECFGADRLIYGSDWPVTILTGDYASVIELTKASLAKRPADVARKVLHDNAIAFYGIADHHTPRDASSDD